MKTTYKILFCLLLAIGMFGCQSESVSPKKDAKDIAASYTPIPRPDAPCGPSSFSQMVDGGMSFGSLEILNTKDNIYLIMDLDPLKFVEEVWVYSGNIANVPMNLNGTINYSSFNYHPSITSPLNDYTLLLPIVRGCTDIVIRARVTTRSPLGTLIATNYAWMNGTTIANGRMLNYCVGDCAYSDPGANTAE